MPKLGRRPASRLFAKPVLGLGVWLAAGLLALQAAWPLISARAQDGAAAAEDLAESRFLEGDFDGARLVFQSMRTKCEILVPRRSGSSEDPRVLAELARTAVLRVASLLSPSGSQSDVARLNEASPGAPVRIDPLSMAAMIEAWAWRERSGGIFEPTLGPVKTLYRFDRIEVESLPDPKVIEKALAMTGAGAFTLDPVNLVAVRNLEGAMMDLGAIGKGLAADYAAEILADAGVVNALINLGGEMRIMGLKPQGEDELAPWTVELVDPLGGPAKYAIEVSDQAVASSGAYGSYFIHQGRAHSHVLDPRTGRPVADLTAGATVVHPASAAAADALATIVSVLGPEETGPWLRERSHLFPDGLRVITLVKLPDGQLEALCFELTPGGALSVTRP